MDVNGKRVRGRQYPWGVAEGTTVYPDMMRPQVLLRLFSWRLTSVCFLLQLKTATTVTSPSSGTCSSGTNGECRQKRTFIVNSQSTLHSNRAHRKERIQWLFLSVCESPPSGLTCRTWRTWQTTSTMKTTAAGSSPPSPTTAWTTTGLKASCPPSKSLDTYGRETVKRNDELYWLTQI